MDKNINHITDVLIEFCMQPHWSSLGCVAKWSVPDLSHGVVHVVHVATL